MKTISSDDIFQNGQIRHVFPIFNPNLLFTNADDNDFSIAKGAAASSSSLRLPLKKLFFEEWDMLNSAKSFYSKWYEQLLYCSYPATEVIYIT